MERGLMMLLHSAIISAVIYLVMVYAMGTNTQLAENRSLSIGAVALLYMLAFGHELPPILKKCVTCSGGK
jgi:hypothetical protein